MPKRGSMGIELVLPALVGQMDFYSDCVMLGESEFPGFMTLYLHSNIQNLIIKHDLGSGYSCSG